MAIPKRHKFSAVHRPSYEGKAKGHRTLSFGTCGLVALEGAYIKENQMEAARRAATRKMKRAGKFINNIFPQIPITRKPAEVRMGSGKGSIDHWVAVVKKDTIMFEVIYPDLKIAHEALRLAMHKLPIKCKIVTKNDQVKHDATTAQKQIEAKLGETNGNASN